MSADEQATDRFQVRATSDSHFGWIRTRLALERTLMSARSAGLGRIADLVSAATSAQSMRMKLIGFVGLVVALLLTGHRCSCRSITSRASSLRYL
jgi:hypothetical protein